VALLSSGCAGYRLGPTNGVAAGEKSIQVIPFSNQTIEPRLGAAVTVQMRKQLQRDGTYRLATHEDGDILVSGAVTHYRRQEVSFIPTDVLTVRDYRLSLTAQVTARERGTGKVLFEQPVTGSTLIRVGADLTSVKCAGEWLHLGLSVDATRGLVLTVDELKQEDAQALKEWMEPIAKSVGAEVFVSDDADGFKTVADELGLQHQVCKSHVKRNTQDLVDELCPKVAQDADGSLCACGVDPAQAEADLKRLGELIVSRKPEEVAELQEMHQRYVKAVPPRKGERASLAYRLRRLFLDRYKLWSRLTGYRTWNENHTDQERLDGTNNACERAIGWWIKERYRSMRGYKQPANALFVSRLLAWCGNFLSTGGAHLTPLIA